MKTIRILGIAFGALLLLQAGLEAKQYTQSGRQFRRFAIMNGNNVRTVFGNWGVIAQPSGSYPRGAWKDDNNGYLGDVSPLIGGEVNWHDTTNNIDTVFHTVASCPVARPTANNGVDESPSGLPWTFEPEDGFFAPSPNQSVALSNDPSTWPPFWPDKMSDVLDPGWKGSWNGYFGKKRSADLETYFVMDDNDDQRYNFAQNNSRRIAFKPDSLNPSRNGMALVLTVRALQWAQFLAADNIFWLYEINNTGTTTYNRMVFGMLVGTYVGVTGNNDSPQEYRDDWSFYNVFQNITYTGDFDRNTQDNPRWNQAYPVGMIGYAFLESPGNPYDGIDNDGDADSSTVGQLAPQFTQTSFDSTVIAANSNIVLIHNDFSRVLFHVGTQPVKVITRGMKDSVLIIPGVTKVAEGNVYSDASGNQILNPNAYDGIDNDFDGLIDENYFLHYHEIKVQKDPTKPPLINIFRPVRYVDYKTGNGTNPMSMIDERRDDCIDNNGDWNVNFDDVGRDGIGPTAVNYPGPDAGEGDGRPTSGYDCTQNPPLDTGEPGEPHIDKTDVRESDQIGLSSFFYFTNAQNPVNLANDEIQWRDLQPGYFDVPPSIVGGLPTQGEDGDFIYGSGYFPVVAKTTERFTLALVFGGGKKGNSVQDDIDDLIKNKATVQKIYDANYQFPTPPDPPTVTAVAGDHQVTLYWDRVAEATVDPVLRIRNFEGYKIYKSTDPNFSDIFTVTDASGNPRGYQPIAQFDKKDSISGYFQAQGDLYQEAAGFSYFLGSETGLQHSYVDKEVDNGRKYYYAVVAYNYGNAAIGIFPSENTHSVRISSTGEISQKDINVVVVTPNAKVAGYIAPPDGVSLIHTQGNATSGISYSVVDPTKIAGDRYRVEFLDTQVDSVDNNGNKLVDAADSTEWDRRTTFYSVRDLQDKVETFTGKDTERVSLSRKNILGATVVVRNAGGSIVSPSLYGMDTARGVIFGASPGSLPAGKYTITYQYDPVFLSPHIQGSPFLVENTEADVFDGVQLDFDNTWVVNLNASASRWTNQNAYSYGIAASSHPLFRPPIRGYTKPCDYEIQFASSIVDTSSVWPPTNPAFPFTTRIPVNFRIFNATESTYIKFLLFKHSGSSQPNSITPLDEVIFLDNNPRGSYSPSWDILFSSRQNDTTIYVLTAGDNLDLKMNKPYNAVDQFEFTTARSYVDAQLASSSLDRIKAVPNPYVTASSFEPPLPPGITSGRGDRKIEFIHLPAQSKITIFTARGDRIATLYHNGSDDGSVSWNVKTDENLDVAFGVYFYVVESPVGNKTGKLAIIK
ncbi:MAG TPA: hypothetical protein VLY03_09920 [Bacteroidota bacterium]|nr:hypothetical protein [Bacteroidota bacterium]